MHISKFIEKDDLRGAISVLENYHPEQALMLHAQLSRVEKEYGLGLISSVENSRARTQISYAITELAKKSQYTIPMSEKRGPDQQLRVGAENNLQNIVIENKRRRPDIADEAQAIINMYRAYADEKAKTPTYDPSGRRYADIEAKEAALISRLKDEQGDAIENIVARIQGFLSDNAPRYEHLKEAYRIAAGRGMKNEWIEQQLQEQPDDIEVRITIAEKIEMFAAKISVK